MSRNATWKFILEKCSLERYSPISTPWPPQLLLNGENALSESFLSDTANTSNMTFTPFLISGRIWRPFRFAARRSRACAREWTVVGLMIMRPSLMSFFTCMRELIKKVTSNRKKYIPKPASAFLIIGVVVIAVNGGKNLKMSRKRLFSWRRTRKSK